MDVKETLGFVDKLLFEKEKRHLNDLETKIIKGLLEGKTYPEIAKNARNSQEEENGYNANHIGEVSRKLYQLLSESLGETINKSNFGWRIESAINSKIFDFGNMYVIECGDSSQISSHKNNNDQEEEIKSKKSYHDLTFAPTLINFFAREKELKILQDWLLNKNTKLVSVVGLKGVGKMHLVKKFVDLNKSEFEVIIWENFKYSQSLDLGLLLDKFLQVFISDIKVNIDDKLKQLLTYLSQKKCLFIFDEFHHIFASGEFAGHYQSEYQNYQDFLKLIIKGEYKSKFILISDEQCDEMHCLNEQSNPVKCLELKGLESIDILKNLGLKDSNYWLELIHLYEGNPTYLKDIAILIRDTYDGKVAEFIAEHNIIITSKMQETFTKIFNRLSPIEKQIILILSKLEKPMSRNELKSSLDLSSMDFVKGLQSLQRRYLLTKIQEEVTLFRLSPVFQKFITDNT